MIHNLGVPRRGRNMMVRRQIVPAPQPVMEEESDESGPIDITPFDFQGMLGKSLGASAVPLAAAADPGPAPATSPPEPAAALPHAASSFLEQFAPIAKSVLTSSAEEDVQVLKAQIKNHERLRDTFPEPFKTIYANKVRVLKARLRAAEKAKVEEGKTQTSRWEWAALGKTSVVVGILAGSALTALLITSAVKAGRK